MSERKFLVKEPFELKIGGWIGQILDPEKNNEIIYETYQLTKKWAFQACVLYLHDVYGTIERKQEG
jgi:hypothetical protein